MEEHNGVSTSLPPFLTKTYEMVDDTSSDSIISWSDHNKSFIVKNPAEFSKDLLPRFFKHKNFSSFIRQLNTYGFRKIDPEKWEFANEDFVRGKPHLMKNIHRRKTVYSHSVLAQKSPPLSESERRSMKDQIERLQREKEVLLADLQSQEVERKGFQAQVAALKERLQHMEQRQRSMVTFVSQVLEKPGLSLNLEETHERRKRKLQETERETSLPLSSRSQVEKLESSLTFLESLVTESCDKSMDIDVNESTSYAESLSNGDDKRSKSAKIDMNAEPVVTVAAAPKTGVNDRFWEQCLTENPGSIEQQEVQSERRDVDANNKIGDGRTFWWNAKNVNDIAERV